ncbi:SAM-dependent methyltransferase [Conyzicola lurida]|uniref:SAM-dependent methyltransferase n=1 Tax=Conyzicola lurida TaxID=1172621 RepID=A0A841AJ76_9MICO|nr:SAM-dependent methyltransferase [Conyzicola lurida]
MVDLGSGDWLDANRAQWDERVPLHVASEFYDQSALRAGHGALYPIEERELADYFPEGLEGKRILHLQCHFGADSLVLAQRGATVVGIDFSKPAVVQARALATEVGLADRARFVNANIYDARHTLPEPESFDIVYTTWGTIGWLPDVAEWARIVEWYLKPGGRLYFADGHPAAWTLDGGENELPTLQYAYETDGVADVIEDDQDYAVEDAGLTNTRTYEWPHPLSETVTALLATGSAWTSSTSTTRFRGRCSARSSPRTIGCSGGRIPNGCRSRSVWD